MLTHINPIPTVAVKDLQTARSFYEKKLGLIPIGETDENYQLYKSGDSILEVYKSEFAGTNKATAVTWTVGENIEKEVSELRNKGIEFEHYQMPNTKLDGDIHVMQDMKVAWFKDPDGNILCVHDH